ncbi:putative membrane protein [Brucella lupini]|uniref:Putative membrane protein n=1 Tax=Brucella lupini TaxID=255457 RepID=A0A256GGG2_9HYPH|nr:putative membrane protein [Brucella lupini]
MCAVFIIMYLLCGNSTAIVNGFLTAFRKYMKRSFYRYVG